MHSLTLDAAELRVGVEFERVIRLHYFWGLTQRA